MPASPALLTARGVSKSFGATAALQAVDVTVHAGEVVSLLGENGAGKSTFAKIVCGLEYRDAGYLALDGKPIDFHSPREAQRSGIAFIPQELAFVPDLTVAENIMLGRLPRTGIFTTPARIMRAAASQLAQLDVDLPLDASMRELTLADVQLVEIVKALRTDIRLMVLDEPTASLTESESDRLFDVIRRYTAAGVGVIFVSHHLEEVLGGTDTVFVFRDGRVSAQVKTRDVTRAQLISHMLGGVAKHEHAPEPLPINPAASVPAAISILDWVSANPPLHNVNLQFSAGEVAVLFGLRGCGADAIAEGLVGARRIESGQLRLAGQLRSVLRSPAAARAEGIAYVPADRRRQGLFMHQSIRENILGLARSRFAKMGWISPRRERSVANKGIADFQIRAQSPEQPIAQLSGGNQQKVLVAGRLAIEPRVIVLQEPTRGVDVGAREELHQTIRTAAGNGVAVIVSTSDLEEAVRLSDRLIVMRAGKVVAELTGSERQEERALALAKGVSDDYR